MYLGFVWATSPAPPRWSRLIDSDDCFNWIYNSVYRYFTENFYIYIHQLGWLIILLEVGSLSWFFRFGVLQHFYLYFQILQFLFPSHSNLCFVLLDFIHVFELHEHCYNHSLNQSLNSLVILLSNFHSVSLLWAQRFMEKTHTDFICGLELFSLIEGSVSFLWFFLQIS